MDLKVFNDDCLNVLKTLEDNSVDCVVTDPPYRIIAGGVKIVVLGDECGGMVSKRDYSKTDPKGVLTRGTTYVVSDRTPCSNKWIKKDGNVPNTVKSGKMFENNEIKFSEWLSEIYRIVKPGTHTYIMINSRNLKELWVEAEKVGFKFQNLLVWSKGNCLGGQTELFIKNKNEGKTELINFEKLYNTFKKGIYQVLSDNGKTWIDIVDCFKNSSEEVNIKEIVFENGTKLKATEEHIFYQNGKEILVKNLKVGDIVDGINNNFEIAEINEEKSVIYDLL